MFACSQFCCWSSGCCFVSSDCFCWSSGLCFCITAADLLVCVHITAPDCLVCICGFRLLLLTFWFVCSDAAAELLVCVCMFTVLLLILVVVVLCVQIVYADLLVSGFSIATVDLLVCVCVFRWLLLTLCCFVLSGFYCWPPSWCSVNCWCWPSGCCLCSGFCCWPSGLCLCVQVVAADLWSILPSLWSPRWRCCSDPCRNGWPTSVSYLVQVPAPAQVTVTTGSDIK